MKRITKPDQSKLHTKSLSEQSKSGSETGIPKHVLEAIVDTMLPDIIAFFETEEGQQEFGEWKAEKQRSERICHDAPFNDGIHDVSQLFKNNSSKETY
ncbi:MAG: hypothetical protein IJL52_05330 [Clostridia bacterium]|nr:hypothetical protein [Clostridia bacterium]